MCSGGDAARGGATQKGAKYETKGNETRTSRRASAGAQSGDSHAAVRAERRERRGRGSRAPSRTLSFGGHARTALRMHLHRAHDNSRIKYSALR